MTTWKVSTHASERWLERFNDAENLGQARRRVQRAARVGRPIPNRLAVDLWHRKRSSKDVQRLRRQHGFRYRLMGTAVLVTQGHTVITVLRATTEELAAVLVWQMMDQWVPDRPALEMA